jgi:hypothetical protein
MRLYSIDSQAMIDKETYIHPRSKPKSAKSARNRAGRTKKVQALLKRLKREGW